MKQVLFTILIVSFCLTANAKIYVALDKTTGEPRGTINIKLEAVADWAEKFILIEADESYRGLHGYELKYKNEKLKKATQAEKDAYKAERKAEQDARRKSDALETLSLTQSDIDKIKNLP